MCEEHVTLTSCNEQCSDQIFTFFIEVRSMEKQLMNVEKPSFFMGSHFWSWPGMSWKASFCKQNILYHFGLFKN